MQVEVWVQDEIDTRWRDVLASIEDNAAGAYELAPWHSLTGEPRREFLAFRHWLDSTERDLAATAVVFGFDTLAQLRRVANTWEWEQRGRCWDQWVDRQTDAVRADLMLRITQENTKAFARLPGMIEKCALLIDGSLGATVREQQTAMATGVPVDYLSLGAAQKLAETMTRLLAETNRFLGTKIDVNVNVGGKVDHDHKLVPTTEDLANLMDGLADAGLTQRRPGAIEASAS